MVTNCPQNLEIHLSGSRLNPNLKKFLIDEVAPITDTWPIPDIATSKVKWPMFFSLTEILYTKFEKILLYEMKWLYDICVSVFADQILNFP